MSRPSLAVSLPKKRRETSTAVVAKRTVQCTRCGKAAKASPLHNVCTECYETAMSVVVTMERDIYLARWLSSRVDERGKPRDDSALVQGNKKLIRLMVAKARNRKLDWVHPPAAMTTEQVMNLALNRSGSERGAKRKPHKPLAG